MRSILAYTVLGFALTVVLPACPESGTGEDLPPIDQDQVDVQSDTDGPTEDSVADQLSDAATNDDVVTDLSEDTPNDAVDVPEDSVTDTPSDSGDDGEEEPTDLMIDSADSVDIAADDRAADSDHEVAPDDTATDPVVPPVRLSFGASTNSSIEIMMENDEPIMGYSFLATGVSLTGAGGGRTQASGLNQITASGTLVVVTSFTEAQIPTGTGLLIVLEFAAGPTSICLGDREFSGVGRIADSVVIPEECHTF